MNSPANRQSIFEIYNARHKKPEEVAISFVPPATTFTQLVARNNHILVGPRGSGKTTLLKMLTLPARYTTGNAGTGLPQPDFIGIFIPADNGWSVQINGKPEESISIGRSAFTTHILLAFVQALLDAKRLPKDAPKEITSIALTSEQEANFVKLASEAWKLSPTLLNLEGLKLSLRQRLLKLHDLKEEVAATADVSGFLLKNAPFITLDFKESISFGLDTYETVSNNLDQTWGLLFDEFEIAPLAIQKQVLQDMRGRQDGRILYKIALAPYNEAFVESFSVQNGAPEHDFTIINLWHPDKKTGLEFSTDLLKKMLLKEDMPEANLWQFLGESSFAEEENAEAYGPKGSVRKAFDNLSKIDQEFNAYSKKNDLKLKLDNWKSLSTEEKAAVRKIRSVVITRNIFLRSKYAERLGTQRRSRKNHVLYTGFPTIVELCEGNPRALISMFTSLIRELKLQRIMNASTSVPDNIQAERIQYAASSFRSLLKTIGYSDHKGGVKSLLHLLDAIGDYFVSQALGTAFHPEPALSFTVDSHCEKNILTALGKALNAGAIIYIPDAKADPIMGSIAGKRFRLNYMLAAYYGLPILMGSAKSLHSILQKTLSFDTLSLFGSEAENG